MKKHQRFYDIDLLRFMAAVSVLLFHYVFCGFGESVNPVISFGQIGHIFKYGYLGVELFFMISGFVILLSAVNKDALGFVISRVVRLYPIYWIGVTLTALCIALYGGHLYSVTWYQYFTNLTMLHGYFGIEHIDAVYWTLLVELRFYILIFILLIFNLIKHIKPILGVWLLATYVITYTGGPHVVFFFLLPGYATYFIAGAILYLIKKEGLSFYKLFILIAAYYLSIKKAFWNIPTMQERYATDFSEYMVVGAVTLIYILMFLVAINKTQIFNKKAMMKLGALTYPLYLLHAHIGGILASFMDLIMNKYVILISITGFMMVLSYLINKIVDQYVSGNFKRALERLRKS